MRIWILIHKQFESRLLERILIWILIRILILKKFECRVLEEGEDVSKCNVMVGGYELKTSIKGNCERYHCTNLNRFNIGISRKKLY